MKFKKTITALLAGLSLSTAANAQTTDFDLVGKEMSRMLMNRHYERLDFDKELSHRIFDLLVTSLDPGKIFFTQEDITKLSKSFGDNLHERLLGEISIEAALEAHDLYKQRVIQRVAIANQRLENNHFDFTTNETVARSREDLLWPENEQAAELLWSKLVKEAVLNETLRRENVARMAKEQGKENPLKDERSIKDILHDRYERILKSVMDEDREDVANYLLSAVAKAYGPHTDYFSAREYDKFKSSMDNSFVGIGAMLNAEDDGSTKISGLVVGGPAAMQGELELNDKIIGVDSINNGEMTDIMFMKIDKVVDLIRGEMGTSVKLKVIKTSGETKFISIKRAPIEMNAEFAKGDIIEFRNYHGQKRRIGVITLPSFYVNFQTGENRCSEDVRKILTRMTQEGIDGLMLDLRGNGGGSLEEVRAMTGLFTGKGPIVQEKDHLGRTSTQLSYIDPIYTGPMVCLIDRSSASASEILAGALQDYNRALIVGSSSFGKGTVQQPMDIARMLPFGAEGRDRAGFLKPTIRKFYRVTGSSTQHKGVEADIALPDMLSALDVGEKYLKYALPHDVIGRARGYTEASRESLFVEKIAAQSDARVKQSTDFKYLNEDIARYKKMLAENQVPLNKAKRVAELAETDQRTKNRNKERRERFRKIQDNDKMNLIFYRLHRDDLQLDELKPYDPSESSDTYMLRAKDETEDLDMTPDFPSMLDPTKRESLNIINDLIDFTIESKVAKLLP